jgi:hypothetical protein
MASMKSAINWKKNRKRMLYRMKPSALDDLIAVSSHDTMACLTGLWDLFLCTRALRCRWNHGGATTSLLSLAVDCSLYLRHDLLQQSRPNMEAASCWKITQYRQHLVSRSLATTDCPQEDTDTAMHLVPKGLSGQTSRRVVGEQNGIGVRHHQIESCLLPQVECKRTNEGLKRFVP